MKRISKRRLAELRRFADERRKVVASPHELIDLIDAYPRKPDEVAEGFWFNDERVISEPSDTATLRLARWARVEKVGEDRRVRVEVYYLKPKGARR